MFLNLVQAYKRLHKDAAVDRVVMDHLIWEIIKIDPIISSFLLENELYVNDLKVRLEDGTASPRIVKKVREILAKEYRDEFASGI